MKQAHQLVHTLSYGDAISGEVLALRSCFRSIGYESEIYCINVHPRYKGQTKDYLSLEDSFNGVVILHYSLGSPLNALYLGLVRAQRVLLYHNVTPAHWFKGVNPRVMRDIESGLAELPSLCRVSNRLLADSTFNADELAALGFPATVLPLPVDGPSSVSSDDQRHDTSRWAQDPNAGILSLLQGDPSLHLLHIGRIAPNKRIEDILKIFYFLHHYVEPKSKLWLVGIDIDTELYSFALKQFVYQLGLEKAVIFTGGVSDEEVLAFYQAASVYCCMSEHEGFCLPVVEAMRASLPVIAYASGAIPETIGNGGILVRKKHPHLIAELIVRVHKDAPLRASLVAEGLERVEALSYTKFTERVASCMEGLWHDRSDTHEGSRSAAGRT